MKIISGIYKGRNLKGFDIDGTRPTMMRVKESLFGMIQDYVKDALVLDLFAGSGNLGFEALSLSAKKVWFVDHNKKAIKAILENASMLGVDAAKEILCLDYLVALKKISEQGIVFDLIFLDPPYKDHIISSILNLLQEYKIVHKDTLVVCEVSSDTKLEKIEGYDLWKERQYQDKAIFIYKGL